MIHTLISKIQSLTKKEENKELLFHSLLSVLVRIGGAAAAFLMNVVVARYLGAMEAGYFFLAVTVTTLLATLARFGADISVLRFVSIHSELQEWNKVRGLMSIIMRWTYIPVCIVTLIVCIFSKQIAVYFFHKPDFESSLFWTSLSMPFFAAYNIHAMALQGRKKVLLSVTNLRILTPFFLIVLVMIFAPAGSFYTSIYYLIACIANLFVGHYWWSKNIPKSNGKKYFDTKLLWKTCLPLWIIAVMQQLVIWGGQFIAGIFSSPSEVAQLSVARTTTSLITFILSAVNNVSAPRFAVMYDQGKVNQLKNYARNTTRLMTIIAFPITLSMWLFPHQIMNLFGKDFAAGDAAWILGVLALGQFINVSTGSVGYLLTMSGHENQLKNIRIINAIVAVVLALILNPLLGALGSAISSAVALASSNLMAVGLVKRKLGFNTMSILGFK
jgi:O-antigen/teichoic acid export membrane protein